MGRGRKGLLDQSVKKTKILKNQVKTNSALFIPERIEENTETQIIISEELLAEMKKMSPQDLMNALIKPEEEEPEEQYELTDLEKFVFDWIDPTEIVYERPIPTFELVNQMMTTMSKDQVRYILEKSLAN